MIFELRVLKSSLVALAAALALLVLQWEFVFPAFALAYLGYKYWYYRQRLGTEATAIDDDETPGRLLEKTLLLFVAVFVVTRLVLFPLFSGIWSVSVLSPPVLDLSDLGVFLDQMGPIASAWGTILVPLGVLSYAAGQFRLRLLAGVDSPEAAIRAALWESFARVPLYLLWAGLAVLGPVYEHWVDAPRTVASSLGIAVPSASGFAPALPDVFMVVVGVGHAVPALVIGASLLIRREKYDDWTVPEVLGYRGLHPPDRVAETVNVAVPLAALGLYAAAVVALNPGGPPVGAILVLPTVVTVVAGADLKGVTSRLTRAVPDWVPGSDGDAVVVGFSAGLYTMGLLAVVGSLVDVGIAVDPVAALYYPLVALPLAFGANWGVAIQKANSVDRMMDRAEADPERLTRADVDRLLAYADARKDHLRARAIDGLATAVWATDYREGAIVDVCRTAIESGDDEFARPGLRGIVMLLRSDRGGEAVARLADTDSLRAVAATLENPDPATRALAAEAFCRIVAAGYRTGHIGRSLTGFDDLPIAAIEPEVTGDGANQDLTDAAVEGFAALWYDRTDGLADVLSAEDERSLLEDLVWWSVYANEVPRGKAAFAVTATPAVTDEAGLDAVLEYLDGDVALVRLMAAHVVRSSMADHAAQVDAEQLLGLLSDDHEQARWAGAEAIQAYVTTTGEGEALFDDLLAHLESRDPTAAGSAEATVLSTLTVLDEGALTDRPDVAATVAGFVGSENRAVAEPAARLLATFLEADPGLGHEGTIMDAIEDGLTHESDAVREQCVRAAAAIVDDAPGNGRPFVRGLVLNLGTAGRIGEMAASTLAEVLDEYPAYGTECLPEMVGGLRNPTNISQQYAGAMLVGRSVSQVTADILADITDHDVSQGDVLIGPLVDLAGNAASGSRESIFKTLANLSKEFPDESREALSAAQAALDEGSVRVRRNAAQVLSNVALEHPDAVAPFVASLVIATDDSDPQTRSIALVTIGSVGADDPEAIEDDVRRVIGRLEDDSSMVREHAAKAIITVAEREPGIVEPTAEASDRLRRLQRDPAVDLDEELLQQAANAIRTGTPPGEAVEGDAGEGETDIFTPESADEMGQSGDTRVFDPSAADLEDGPADDDENPEAESDGGPAATCDDCGTALPEDDDAQVCPECGADLT